MKSSIRQTLLALALLALATLNAPLFTASAQGTAFTYQGRLNSNGTPAAGTYDFRFRLASDPLANNYVGSAYLTNGIPVTNGLFTTTMNFGPGIFTGSSLWLEVDVRTNGGGGYTVLNPLQALTPTPYAVFANTASNLTGTLPAAQLSGMVGNGQLTHNTVTVTAGSGLSGGGAVALGGTVTLTATGVTSLAGGGGVTVSAASGAVTLGSTATSANTASAIVSRDGSRNFSAGSITLAGNLNLPVAPVTITSGGSSLLRADTNQNFFAGIGAGKLTTSGNINTALGYQALSANTTGVENTVTGAFALISNTTGSFNTANGFEALSANTTGKLNTAIGYTAGTAIMTGSSNIAIGYNAGLEIMTGSDNIDIGNEGYSDESNTIRIGTTQTKAVMQGIFGVTVGGGAPVYVNSSGLLGTLTSSRRFKQNIQKMDDASDVLLDLQPVTFQYKSELDPEGNLQFGLIAEDVEKVDPALVVHDDKHQIYSVRYEAVNAMLLNEFLKEHRKVEDQSAEIATLKETAGKVDTLEKRLGELEQMMKSLKTSK